MQDEDYDSVFQLKKLYVTLFRRFFFCNLWVLNGRGDMLGFYIILKVLCILPRWLMQKITIWLPTLYFVKIILMYFGPDSGDVWYNLYCSKIKHYSFWHTLSGVEWSFDWILCNTWVIVSCICMYVNWPHLLELCLLSIGSWGLEIPF